MKDSILIALYVTLALPFLILGFLGGFIYNALMIGFEFYDFITDEFSDKDED